jgi:hypothetical protein
MLLHYHPDPLSREGLVVEVCASDSNSDTTDTTLTSLTEASSLLAAAALPPQPPAKTLAPALVKRR